MGAAGVLRSTHIYPEAYSLLLWARQALDATNSTTRTHAQS